MSIRAVIFDIGGVIEMTPATGWKGRWSAELGLAGGELETRLERIAVAGSTGRVGLREAELRIQRELGLDDAALARLMADLWAEYLGSLNHELVAYFVGLRPQYRTAMLSNSFVGAREREEARYGLERMCDVIVYSHEEGFVKPDARLYDVACERLRVSAGDCAFLDDVPANVEGARSVGMHALTFENNEQAIQELDELLRANA